MSLPTFKTVIEMIEYSIENGLLQDKIKKSHSYDRFSETINGEKIEYIEATDAHRILKGVNAGWSTHYMEKAIREKKLRALSKSKYKRRWISIKDFERVKEQIKISNCSDKNQEGRFKFTEVFVKPGKTR